ncbi:hypothetical protein EMPS_04978 [Entomortierella parvispora]|uniref:Uncharacterized protein n=1 Tax=Entomortierella parvispora TaxID=205924 RepID=A0A9P3H9U4_9FUNG|nr:hypothetical protein EMPS_04978 [Entomortierella parvispora]
MTSVSTIEQPEVDNLNLSTSGITASKRIRLASDTSSLEPAPEHNDLDISERTNRKTPCSSADRPLDSTTGIGQDAKAVNSETDVCIGIINILRPSESVLGAMQRLGDFTGRRKNGCRKVHCIEPLREPPSTTPQERNAKKQSSQDLAALCDQMVAFGRFGIYEETYEQLVQTLRKEGVLAPSWRIGDSVQASSQVRC